MWTLYRGVEKNDREEGLGEPAASAMYPMMSAAIERMERETVNMSGTAVLTTTRFDAVADAATAKAESQQKKEEPAPTGLGGLGGRLARRVLERDKDKAEPLQPPCQVAPR